MTWYLFRHRNNVTFIFMSLLMSFNQPILLKVGMKDMLCEMPPRSCFLELKFVAVIAVLKSHMFFDSNYSF